MKMYQMRIELIYVLFMTRKKGGTTAQVHNYICTQHNLSLFSLFKKATCNSIIIESNENKSIIILIRLKNYYFRQELKKYIISPS